MTRITWFCHFGGFGQAAQRPEQGEAVDFLEPPDGLFGALGVEPRLDSHETDDLPEGVVVFAVRRP